jgi:hypothetical protein
LVPIAKILHNDEREPADHEDRWELQVGTYSVGGDERMSGSEHTKKSSEDCDDAYCTMIQ